MCSRAEEILVAKEKSIVPCIQEKKTQLSKWSLASVGLATLLTVLTLRGDHHPIPLCPGGSPWYIYTLVAFLRGVDPT